MRTIETAHELFPNHTVYPMPYVGNFDLREDNLPLPISCQKKILTQLHDTIHWVNWKYVDHLPEKNRGCADFIKFLDYYTKLPIYEDSTTQNIAIVTHSKLMKAILSKLSISDDNDIVENNTIIKIVYELPIVDPYHPYSCEIIHSGLQRPNNNHTNFHLRCDINH